MFRATIIWLLVILVEAGLVVSFAEARSLEKLMASEHNMSMSLLGEQRGQSAYKRAEQVFRLLFVESGFVRFSYASFSVSPNNSTNKDPGMDMAKGVVDYMDGRVDAFWAMSLLSLQRLIMGLSWLPFMVLLLVPAAIDGLVQRQIKKTNFGYTSPVRHQLALFGLVGLMFLPFLLALFPFYIGPLLAPIWTAIVAFGVLILFANTQKAI
jgi:hypothetical protein